MRQSVEIERLLHWAFRSELPKREGFGPRGARSAWQSVESYARLGCRVHSNPSASGPAIPQRDALIIADEVAGLRGSVTVDLRQADLLGLLAPLSEVIANPRIRLSETDLVEAHARAGVSPDWCRHPPKAMPVIGPNGKPAVEGKRYGKDRYSERACCPLRWGDPTIESIARGRAEYTVWWLSLDRLAKSLNGKLKDHVASPPAALRAPWTRPH
jgi:hypothetical protein